MSEAPATPDAAFGATEDPATRDSAAQDPTAQDPAPATAGRAVRLTATGVAVAFSSVACLVLAYAFGYPAFAALGVGGLAVLAVVPLAARNAPIEVGREVYPRRVARGESAVGLLTVRNPTSRWGRRLSARERVGAREIPVRIGQLPPQGAVEIRYELPTDKRAVLTVGPLHWDRTDPLGLVGRRSALPGTAVLHVHPVVYRFPLGTAAQHAHGEQARTDLALEGSITFHTLREYVPGDDLRKIHWRASAHRGELMVRQNIDVTPPRATVVLITDAGLYADPDDFEQAVDVAASAALGAVREGQAVSLWTTGGLRLASLGGAEDSVLFLDRLAAVTLDRADRSSPRSDRGDRGDRAAIGLADTVNRLEHSEPGGALIVVGGHPQPTEVAALSRLTGRFGVTVLARIGAAGQSAGGTGLTVLEAPTAAELCARWARLAPARGGAR